MEYLRTPENRFQQLPDYPFDAHYCDIDSMRMHYVEEGPADAAPVLMLHGEPSWSFLYRHMIPVVAAAGHRVIAPDLIGFGKSDKPVKQDHYSYAGHMDWLLTFLDRLQLKHITLVCQDWGSLLGLRLAAEHPDRFDRIVLSNGGLPTGEQTMPASFKHWQRFARWSPWFPIGKVIQYGTRQELSQDVVQGYDAPFPNRRYKAGARAFPALVPTQPSDPASTANKAAWNVLCNWQKPFATAFSNRDPITRGGDQAFVNNVPGAKISPHTTIRGAGHFVQEEAGKEFAEFVNEVIQKTPT